MTLKELKNFSFLIGCIISFNLISYAQDQQKADSLYSIIVADTVTGKARMELLKDYSYNENLDFSKALIRADELIRLAEEQKDSSYMHSGFLQKGHCLKNLGNFPDALKAYQKSERIAENIDYHRGQVSANMALATTYIEMGDEDNAIKYLNESSELARDPRYLNNKEDSIAAGIAIFNAADIYLKLDSYNNALGLLEEADSFFEPTKFNIGRYYVTGDRGIYFAKLEDHKTAKKHLFSAIDSLLPSKDFKAMAEYLLVLAEVHFTEDSLIRARNAASRSLEYSLQGESPMNISKASLMMSKLDSINGDYASANKHLWNYINYKEDLFNEDKLRDVHRTELNYVLDQKDSELEVVQREKELEELKNEKQRYFNYATLVLLLFIGILAVGYFRRYEYIKKTKAIIESEMDRSDKLLLNILPKETAKELKVSGKVQANRYESVTVMFTDFADFTSHAERINPELLVKSVDYYFSKFDDIMDKYGLEKIKTLGDSYMCAGGLPFISPDHAHKMVEASREIIDFVDTVDKNKDLDLIKFKIRIGINTGPLIAGIVGKKKFAYDIWGDTVNIASRMESASESGKINVSEYTYNLIKYDYDCEFRGSIDVKKRGKMNMYYVGDPK